MNVTMSISIGLYPKLDLWTANKLHYITLHYITLHYITLPLRLRIGEDIPPLLHGVQRDNITFTVLLSSSECSTMQRLFLRPRPLHYCARQPRREHCGTQTGLRDLQNSGGRARNSSQILRSQGTNAFSSVQECWPFLKASFETYKM
jgi:hypothetical protein